MRFASTKRSNLCCKADCELWKSVGADFATSNRYEAVIMKLTSLFVSFRNSASNSSERAAISKTISSYSSIVMHPGNNRYQSRIRINKKRINLGYYSNPNTAYMAYVIASAIFHGEYSRID